MTEPTGAAPGAGASMSAAVRRRRSYVLAACALLVAGLFVTAALLQERQSPSVRVLWVVLALVWLLVALRKARSAIVPPSRSTSASGPPTA